MTGFDIIPNEILRGTKLGVCEGWRIAVPPEFYSLLKTANTQRELVALLKSLKVLNLGPSEHDAQWYADTAQILSARFAEMTGGPS